MSSQLLQGFDPSLSRSPKSQVFEYLFLSLGEKVEVSMEWKRVSVENDG